MRLKGRDSRSCLEAWDWKEENLDLVSKHETERKKFSISSRELKKASRYALRCTPRYNQFIVHWNLTKKETLFQEILKNTHLFLKISINKKTKNVILENSRENCLNLNSRSRLETRDWKMKFPFSSRSTRLRKRNSRSRLEHEIGRKKFSFPSRELK